MCPYLVPPKLRLWYFADVYSANTNTSFCHIPEARNQIGNRALSATRRTNNGRYFALSGYERYIVEGFNRSARIVRE